MKSIYGYLGTIGVPIMIHASLVDANGLDYNRGGVTGKQILENMLSAYPATTFILAHMGDAPADTIVDLLAKHTNLYVDVSCRNDIHNNATDSGSAQHSGGGYFYRSYNAVVASVMHVPDDSSTTNPPDGGHQWSAAHTEETTINDGYTRYDGVKGSVYDAHTDWLKLFNDATLNQRILYGSDYTTVGTTNRWDAKSVDYTGNFYNQFFDYKGRDGSASGLTESAARRLAYENTCKLFGIPLPSTRHRAVAH